MSNQSKITFYDILGISVDATTEQIRAAYRKQAKLAHPDMGGSAHMMQLLNKAFRVLKEPESRAEYDKSLHEAKTEPRHYNEGSSDTSTPPPRSTSEQYSAEELIRQEKQAVEQIKMSARKIIAKGFGLLILGIIITAISYSMTSSDGSYYIFWGLSLWGAAEIFRGWYYSLNPYSSLHKILDTPNKRYTFLLEKSGQHFRAVSLITLSCVGIAVLIIILASLDTSGNTNSTAAPTLDSHGYPTAYAGNFTQSCMNNGGSSSGCTCALDIVESTYTYDQATQIEGNGTLPTDLSNRISNECRY